MNATPSLDGRRFVGVVLERGQTSGDADTLIFENGRFRSTACDRYGYGDADYRVSSSDAALTFEAQTASEKYGLLRWHGVVRGARLDGTLTMVGKDGQVGGEKWVLAGELPA